MDAGELSGASMVSLSGPEAEGLGWYGHWYGHSFAETIPRTDSWSWAADPEDHWYSWPNGPARHYTARARPGTALNGTALSGTVD